MRTRGLTHVTIFNLKPYLFSDMKRIDKKRLYEKPVVQTVGLEFCSQLLTGSGAQSTVDGTTETTLGVIMEEEDW